MTALVNYTWPGNIRELRNVLERSVIVTQGKRLRIPKDALDDSAQAPDGAVLKRSAASPRLLAHRGPAVVFSDIHDLSQRIDDPDLEVTEDSVLVLQRGGPKGAPGSRSC